MVDLLSICRGTVGHFKHSSLAYGKLHQIQESLNLPRHRLKWDEPTRWNSSLYMLQSIIEQKMAIAAYGSENDMVLSQTQLDLANKVIKVLEPIEEITKSVSEELACISVVIPLIRALTKTLGQDDEDHGMHRMKAEMLRSIDRRFADVEEKEVLVLATIMDPRFKDKFFSSVVSRQNTKKMLLDECARVRENDPCYSLAEPPSKRPANDETTSKLWGCLTEILSESTAMSGEDQDMNSNLCEVERYLAEPLLDFKVGNPFKWWAVNLKSYPLLSGLANKYLSAPPTSVASERVFSGAGIIYDDRRSRISPELAEKLLLIRCNFPLVTHGN